MGPGMVTSKSLVEDAGVVVNMTSPKSEIREICVVFRGLLSVDQALTFKIETKARASGMHVTAESHEQVTAARLDDSRQVGATEGPQRVGGNRVPVVDLQGIIAAGFFKFDLF